MHWKGDCGAELWIQVDRQGRFLDIQPHYSSMATMRIGLIRRLARPTDRPLDGAWQGWADPLDDEDPQNGRFELTFEAPDFQLHHDLELPIVASVQLAAFAHTISVFDSVESYRAATVSGQQLEPQSFIPSTQTVRERGETEPLTAEALVCGYILQYRLLVNDLTGRPFYWIFVETLGGRIDLLVDPELLSEEPIVGGVVMTLCWLSGRVL